MGGAFPISTTAWKRRVRLTGEMLIDRQTGAPVRLEVEEIYIFPEASEIPRIDDMPPLNIADGIESSEYVRGLRDGE